MSDQWTPIHQPNGVFCSPRCGFKCTHDAYDRAVKEGETLAKRMGPGWQSSVWENAGWHYRVVNGIAEITVNMKQTGWQDGSWTIRDYTAWLNGDKQFIASAETPEDAFGFVIHEARSFIDRFQGQLGLSDSEAEAITAWNTRTPAPAPVGGDEPVAWMYERNGCYVLKKNRAPEYTSPVMGHTEIPLYAEPQSPPEPEKDVVDRVTRAIMAAPTRNATFATFIHEDEARSAARAAIAAMPPKVEQWQPIETAPKDGTIIDLWAYWPEHEESYRTAEAHWNGRCWQLGDLNELQFKFPPTITHWMPYPAPPKDSKS